jgi:hypothetical protein
MTRAWPGLARAHAKSVAKARGRAVWPCPALMFARSTCS